MFKKQSKVLPFIGLFIMLAVSAVAYIQDSVFFDKIVVCNIILTMVFFAKMKSENTIKRTETKKIK